MLNEDHKEEVVHTTEGTPRWLGVAVVALAAVSLLALGSRLERHEPCARCATGSRQRQ